MEKEKVVVNDTNVFIDLYSIDLLKEFFSLPWEVPSIVRLRYKLVAIFYANLEFNSKIT